MNHVHFAIQTVLIIIYQCQQYKTLEFTWAAAKEKIIFYIVTPQWANVQAVCSRLPHDDKDSRPLSIHLLNLVMVIEYVSLSSHMTLLVLEYRLSCECGISDNHCCLGWAVTDS